MTTLSTHRQQHQHVRVADLTISSAQLTQRKVGVGPIPPAVALSMALLAEPAVSEASVSAPAI